jgi:hypothetical protein
MFLPEPLFIGAAGRRHKNFDGLLWISDLQYRKSHAPLCTFSGVEFPFGNAMNDTWLIGGLRLAAIQIDRALLNWQARITLSVGGRWNVRETSVKYP